VVIGMGEQRGVVLVLVLMAMAMLAAAGLGLTLGTSVSRMGAANYDESVALVNAAESALEIAARELSTLPLDEVLNGTRTSTRVDGVPGPRALGADATVDLQVLTSQLTCGRAESCTTAQIRQVSADRPWGISNPRWQLFVHQRLEPPAAVASALATYVIVWIGDDAREDDGDPLRDGAGPGGEGRYIVRARAEAFGPRGGRRAIEAELRRLCDDSPTGAGCVPGSRVQSWRVVSAQVP
jgi:Tfp pilus assembly protein PilX